MVLFYALSFLSGVLGLGFLARVISLWILDGSMPEISFLTMCFLMLTSIQTAFFAMWMDMAANRDLR
jgi:hypothetical protein